MLPQLYEVFTTYEGMYLCYLIPIIYFSGVVFTTLLTNRKLRKHAGMAGMIAVIAMMFITLDFVNYLYLLFTKTGKLLPPTLLSLKYVIGLGFWGWVVVYCYRAYFSRQAAGKLFRQRLLVFGLVIVMAMILAGLGIALFPAHQLAVV